MQLYGVEGARSDLPLEARLSVHTMGTCALHGAMTPYSRRGIRACMQAVPLIHRPPDFQDHRSTHFQMKKPKAHDGH